MLNAELCLIGCGKVQYLLCIFDSTAEVESSFSSLRALSSGVKGRVSSEHRDELMKAHSDAPDPSETLACNGVVPIF